MPLQTTGQVIDALGGNKKVAQMTGSTTNSVSGWRKGKFPAATYVALRIVLAKKKLAAPDTLWSMRKPGSRARR